MKLLVPLLLLAIATVKPDYAQTTGAESTNAFLLATNWPAMILAKEAPSVTAPGPLSDEAFAALIVRNAHQTPMISNELKPNEITIGKFTYSGIAVEIVKMPNPLQILNPFAPAQYGTAEINLVRDLGGHPSGLKFFSIQF